jgi:DNA ligase-associated metallophosphoesterase
MEKVLEINLNGEQMMLHPFGALYWPKKQALLLADVHIGKVEHFRKSGLAIPQGISTENFNRLDKVLDVFKPLHLIFLGDLFHSTKNKAWDRFFSWLNTKQLTVSLVIGNHDRYAEKVLSDDDLNLISHLELDDFYLTHHPEDQMSKFNVCGHIHPGVVIRGRGRAYAKSACFAVENNRIILPAFGVFTGLHPIEPETCKSIYVCTPDEVLQLK